MKLVRMLAIEKVSNQYCLLVYRAQGFINKANKRYRLWRNGTLAINTV